MGQTRGPALLSLTVSSDWYQGKHGFVHGVDLGCPLTVVPQLLFSKPLLSSFLFPSGLKGSICLLCAVALIIYIPNPTSSGLRKCFPERIFQDVRGQSIHVPLAHGLKDRKDSDSSAFYPFPFWGAAFPTRSSCIT